MSHGLPGAAQQFAAWQLRASSPYNASIFCRKMRRAAAAARWMRSTSTCTATMAGRRTAAAPQSRRQRPRCRLGWATSQTLGTCRCAMLNAGTQGFLQRAVAAAGGLWARAAIDHTCCMHCVPECRSSPLPRRRACPTTWSTCCSWAVKSEACSSCWVLVWQPPGCLGRAWPSIGAVAAAACSATAPARRTSQPAAAAATWHRYPDENDYDAFLTAHGGASNACTEEVRG